MLTVREIKARTETFLTQKGVPNAKLDTDILIAHSLGLKRLDLYLDLDRPLTEAQLDALRPLVKRRAGREPLQYIVGSTEFYGLTLKVDARALIPRHETEELVDRIFAHLTTAPQSILDLGTGSGALALALASKYLNAAVTAIDLSADALALARENAAALGLTDRIQFLEGSWLEPLAGEARFDLIVANPPYLTEAEMETAEPEVVLHEPHSALVSGGEGLDDLRHILASAKDFLNPGGHLAMETGIAQHAALKQLAETHGLTGESMEDMSGRPRFFLVH
ncbi:MAG: peptide chain release factor N(5)-glutamine methyltransferase [Puniceicoccaceae bacterium]|nr:MAG: peptide chain release factor N(5)-glutamine methyltransferase [Puniceicoccaceae bacterium]